MQQFVEGAKRIHGVSEKVTVPLWETIEAFSVYGFNKSLHFNNKIDILDYRGEVVQQVPICKVRPGSLVRSRDERTGQDVSVRVRSVHDHGKIPMFKITLDTGEEVTCSMHHKFRVQTGEMLPLWMIIQEDLSIVTAESSSPRDVIPAIESSARRGLDEAWWEVTSSSAGSVG